MPVKKKKKNSSSTTFSHNAAVPRLRIYSPLTIEEFDNKYLGKIVSVACSYCQGTGKYDYALDSKCRLISVTCPYCENGFVTFDWCIQRTFYIGNLARSIDDKEERVDLSDALLFMFGMYQEIIPYFIGLPIVSINARTISLTVYGLSEEDNLSKINKLLGDYGLDNKIEECYTIPLYGMYWHHVLQGLD